MANLQFTPEKNTTMLIKEKTTSISRAFLVIRMLFFTTVIALSVLIATGISLSQLFFTLEVKNPYGAF
jgi:nitrogen fixation protein FixH